MPGFKKGYTLIELLVVITIMGLLSVSAIVYWRSLSSGRMILKSIDDIQTIIKLAQSNATTGFSCDGAGGATDWFVKVDKSTKNKLYLYCNKKNPDGSDADVLVRTLTLENVEFDAVQVIGSACESVGECPEASSFPDDPLTVSFSPLYGKMQISGGGASGDCLNSLTSVRFKLKRVKYQEARCFTISTGGAINVQ